MRLFATSTFLLLIATSQAADTKTKTEKRRAETTYITTSKPSYATATPSPSYLTAATTAPVYSTKLSKTAYLSQPVSYEQQQVTIAQPTKIAYAQPSAQTKYITAPQQQQQFSYAFEAAQPDLKYALAQQLNSGKYILAQPQDVRYVSQPQAEVRYVSQPQADVKYVSQAQPEVRYAYTQPAPAKVTAPVNKISYQAPASIAYATHLSPQAVSAQPHYSPANTVSSFSFSNPHVTYSNLGVLSQVIGKQPSSQLSYAPSPQSTHYVSPGAQQVRYVQRPQPQIQYASEPIQYQTAQPVQYQSAQPVQYATAQVQYVPAQTAAHQGSHSTPVQYIYVPQGHTIAPKSRSDATPGIIYA